jgi:hypothetical protein
MDKYNLTDSQWENGEDGVYLTEDGWYTNQNGQVVGPFLWQEEVESIAPQFFD